MIPTSHKTDLPHTTTWWPAIFLIGTWCYAAQSSVDPNLVMRVNKVLLREAWTQRIGTLEGAARADSGSRLQDLIRRVRAMHLPAPSRQLPQPDGPTPADTNSPRQIQPEDKQVAEATGLARLDLTQLDPNKVVDPFKLAEVLCVTGHRCEAAPYYEMALSSLDAADPNSAGQRQWILLQLGRCLLESDPLKSRRTFSQLISDYPTGQWVLLARTLQQLADWYASERPMEAIEQVKATSGNRTGRTGGD